MRVDRVRARARVGLIRVRVRVRDWVIRTRAQG